MEEENKTNNEQSAEVAEESKADNQNIKSDADLQNDFDELKKLSEEYLNGWKRAKADYINLQKEKEKERKEIVEFANAALIAELLPIYTNLKKAVEHANKTLMGANSTNIDANVKGWVEGVKAIKKQWSDIFKVVGIEEIKTVGEKFNPEFHEAVKASDPSFAKATDGKQGAESKERGAEEITEELEPGYTFKGKVIYPAKVVVS